MEKQMALFELEINDDLHIWMALPKENKEKIETIFAQILIRHLGSSSKEVKNHGQ